jgi:hypothetical protein
MKLKGWERESGFKEIFFVNLFALFVIFQLVDNGQ